MGKRLHFGLITSHGLFLGFEAGFYIKKGIGLEGRYEPMERPVGGGRNLKGIEISNAMAFRGPCRRQHCPMRDMVVHVKIGTTVRENGVRRMFFDQFFYNFNHVENRKGIEAIVRQVIQEQVFDAECVSGAPAVFAQIAQLETVGFLPGGVARCEAFSKDGNFNVMALRAQPRHGSAATENFVIWVSRDHEDTASMVSDTLCLFRHPFGNRMMAPAEVEGFLKIAPESDRFVFSRGI